jgi:hypothetical protein
MVTKLEQSMDFFLDLGLSTQMSFATGSFPLPLKSMGPFVFNALIQAAERVLLGLGFARLAGQLRVVVSGVTTNWGRQGGHA